MGHETGHYVLHHIYQFIVFFALVIAVGFLVLRTGFDWAIRRWGARWAVRGVDDPAGMPLLTLIFTVYLFLLTPILNTYIRENEGAADIFGLNAARQPDGFALIALKLGEYRKLDPGPIEELFWYDHPSGRARIRMAMQWKAVTKRTERTETTERTEREITEHRCRSLSVLSSSPSSPSLLVPVAFADIFSRHARSPTVARAAPSPPGRSRAGRGRRARRATAQEGQAHGARAAGSAARPGQLRRARPLRHPPLNRLRSRPAGVSGRRRRHGVGPDRRPPGVRLLAGLHRVRRLALRGARREDLQGDGPGDAERRAGDRPQRFGRRPDSGGRRIARRIRRHLPPQHARVGRRAADLRHPRSLRRRRGVQPGHHRLHLHGPGGQLHVRHRPERGEDGHPRGSQLRRARRRRHPRRHVRRLALRARLGAGIDPGGARAGRLPAAQQPRGAAAPARPTTRSTAGTRPC